MNFKSDKQSEKILSKEDFSAYAQLRSDVLNLKGKRSDLFDMLRNAEKQIASLQEEFRANQEMIEKLEMEFQTFIDDLGKKYELGNGLFNISETEPHVIKIV